MSADYNVIWRSGCDFIIERSTSRTKNYLAVMMSQGQVNIGNETIRPALVSDIADFMKDCDETYINGTYVLKTGVDWMPYFYRGVHFAEGLISIKKAVEVSQNTGTIFADLVKKEMIVYDPGRMPTTKPFREIDQSFESNELMKKIVLVIDGLDLPKDFVRRYLSRQYHLNTLSSINSNRTDRAIIALLDQTLTASSMTYGSHERSVEILIESLSLEGLRAYLNTLIALDPASIELIFIGNGVCSRNVEKTWYHHDLFKEYSFRSNWKRSVEYITKKRIAQGFFSLGTYYDYLNMQKQVYGSVKNKYPKNLETEHQKLSLKVTLLAKEIEERKYDNLCETLDEYVWENDDYIIKYPATHKEFIDEAIGQSNCLASYEKKYLDRKTNIFFMRKKLYPEKPYLTIEVRDNKIRQALLAHNAIPPLSDMEVVCKWAKEKHINYAGNTSCALAA